MKRICKHFSGGGDFATRTQLLKGFVSLLLVTSAFTACTNESEVFNQSSPKLDVKFGVALQESRAILNDECLPDNSKVGVALDDGAATVYDGYSPLYFTSTGTGSSQTWTSNTDVAMTSVEATLYAYYPYDGNVDISAIPIDMTAADQTDWLYATPVANVNEDNASVAVTLNHALANINVLLVKGSYVGTGNVTSISVQSDGIAPKGTFNAAQATPGYTAFEDEGAAIERTVTTTLGGTATDIMVVPTGSSETITFNVTVDGTVFTATSAAVGLEKGSSYKYTLTLNSTFMSVSDVSVTPWNVVTKETLTLEKSNKGVGTIDLTTVANGVYAVAQNGKGVTIDDADETCIAVALITDNQKIMIEKNGEANTNSIKAAYLADGATNTDYMIFYWGEKGTDGVDVSGITNIAKVDGTNSKGYLGGTSTPQLSTDFSTWTAGALSDFDGKNNTAELQTVTSSDSYTVYANMSVWSIEFNKDTNNAENHGYTDWYIPACGQLALIYLNMNEINTALSKIGGTVILSEYYWCSTEYSGTGCWRINFANGYVESFAKNFYCHVRFVRDIN